MNNAGIYQIKNIINCKIYIGSSLNIKNRFYTHKTQLNSNKHYNKKLQRSWNKYGEENFVFEVIEYVENKSELIVREQFYLDTILFASTDIKKFNALGFNNLLMAYGTYGRKLSKESRLKISKKRKGIIFSKETKEKMSAAKIGVPGWSKGKKLTDKQKSKFSKAQKLRYTSNPHPRQKSVLQYSITGEFIKEWNSASEAGRELKINNRNINSVCLNDISRKQAGGYIWRYK